VRERKKEVKCGGGGAKREGKFVELKGRK